ncbi:hypothetical protein M408DRAFT_333336 [Serendipita vermifera MAFF 305830]|uniref:Uncharacterized protein n=1 Tax=Serendipita vermifera MAFF 305830 TaxID=933852 RepID=A0A0C3AAJ1_SERVB|nr:hypothetical protein M408DRAFT_333336 [Serendipita vermifera MAFF 305830]
MQASARLLRAAATSSNTAKFGLKRVSPSCIVHSRHFHASQTASKKKGKQAQNQDLFDENDDGSDADELFGSLKAVPKSQQKVTQANKSPQRHANVTSTRPVDDKAAELLRQKETQRRDAFQEAYDYLNERTGDAGKQSASMPAKRALHNLVNNAASSDEWDSVVSILKQWRRYPTRAIPTGIQDLFIRRAILTGQASVLVDILTHHPVYGIHVSSPYIARVLLKHTVTPVNSYPPSYSNKQADVTVFRQRLEHALQLADVLSITPAKGPATTLSPSADPVLGPLLLCSLLRVAAMPSEGGDPTTLANAIHQLFGDMRASQDAKKAAIQPPKAKPLRGALGAHEVIWSVAALRECETALGTGATRKLLEKATAETPRATVDEMLAWIGQKREEMMMGCNERGSSTRRKTEAASFGAEGPNSLQATSGKGSIPNHLLGKESGNASEKRV